MRGCASCEKWRRIKVGTYMRSESKRTALERAGYGSDDIIHVCGGDLFRFDATGEVPPERAPDDVCDRWQGLEVK